MIRPAGDGPGFGEPEEIRRLVVIGAREEGDLPYAVTFSAHAEADNPRYRITVDILQETAFPDEENPSRSYCVASGIDYGYLSRIWRREALEELPQELVRPVELYAEIRRRLQRG